MLNFRSNVRNAVQNIQRTVRDVRAAPERALDRTAQLELRTKLALIERTYKRPIPRSRNGRPRWVRSGAWRNGQTIQATPGRRAIVTVGPAARYENRLANLNTVRRNAAGAEAHAIVEKQMRAIFEDEYRKALGLR